MIYLTFFLIFSKKKKKKLISYYTNVYRFNHKLMNVFANMKHNNYIYRNCIIYKYSSYWIKIFYYIKKLIKTILNLITFLEWFKNFKNVITIFFEIVLIYFWKKYYIFFGRFAWVHAGTSQLTINSSYYCHVSLFKTSTCLLLISPCRPSRLGPAGPCCDYESSSTYN